MQGPKDGSPSLRSSINVTPLADVMLVLLIIFMVVTPMMRSGVDVQVPEAEHSTEHPDNEETLVLSLKGDGSLYLNEDKIPEDDLLPALTSILSERNDKVLFLKANEVLDYGYVLEMMDRCRTGGRHRSSADHQSEGGRPSRLGLGVSDHHEALGFLPCTEERLSQVIGVEGGEALVEKHELGSL